MTIAYRDLDISDMTQEAMADAVGFAFDYIDYCEAGGKEPRKTARYLQILEARKHVVEMLKTGERNVVEAVFHATVVLQVEADRDLRERIRNGQNPAIPAAERISRRKS